MDYYELLDSIDKKNVLIDSDYKCLLSLYNQNLISFIRVSNFLSKHKNNPFFKNEVKFHKSYLGHLDQWLSGLAMYSKKAEISKLESLKDIKGELLGNKSLIQDSSYLTNRLGIDKKALDFLMAK